MLASGIRVATGAKICDIQLRVVSVCAKMMVPSCSSVLREIENVALKDSPCVDALVLSISEAGTLPESPLG